MSHPIQIRITAGRSDEALFETVDSVKAQLRQLPATRNVGDDWGLRTKKMVITVDQVRARNVTAAAPLRGAPSASNISSKNPSVS